MFANRHWITFFAFQLIWALLVFPCIKFINEPLVRIVIIVFYFAGVIFILASKKKWPFDWVNYVPDHPSGKLFPSPGSTRIQWSVSQALGEAGFYSINIDVLKFSLGDIEDAELNTKFHTALIGNPRFTLRDHLAFISLLKSQKSRAAIELRY